MSQSCMKHYFLNERKTGKMKVVSESSCVACVVKYACRDCVSLFLVIQFEKLIQA